MTSVGDLTLSLRLDTTSYEAQKRQLQRDMSSPLTFDVNVRVNDSRLYDLNRHLDLKQSHYDRLQRHFDNNPLTPKVDTSQLERLERLYSMSGRGGTINVQHSLEIPNIEAQLKKIHDKLGNQKQPGLGSYFFQGVGIATGQDTSRLVGNKIKSQIEKQIGSFELLDRKVTEKITKKLTDALAGLPNSIKQPLEVLSREMKKEIESFLGEFDLAVEKNSRLNKEQRKQNNKVNQAREGSRDNVKTLAQDRFVLLNDVNQINSERNDIQKRVAAISRILSETDSALSEEDLNVYTQKLEEFEKRELELSKSLKEKRNALARNASSLKNARQASQILSPESQNKVYLDLIRQLNKGKLPKDANIPQLATNDELLKKKGGNAAYLAESNTIVVNSQLKQAIDQGKLTAKQINLLLHEIQHAIDFDFGSNKGLAAQERGEILSKPLVPTEEEISELIPFLAQYKPEDRVAELNAELAARRNTPEFQENLDRQNLTNDLFEIVGYGGIDFQQLSSDNEGKLKSILEQSALIEDRANKLGVTYKSVITSISNTVENLDSKFNPLIRLLENVATGEVDSSQIKSAQQKVAQQIRDMRLLLSTFEDFKQIAISEIGQIKDTGDPKANGLVAKPMPTKGEQLKSALVQSSKDELNKTIQLFNQALEAINIQLKGKAVNDINKLLPKSHQIASFQDFGGQQAWLMGKQGLSNAGGIAADALRFGYGAMEGVENAVFPFLPGAKQIKQAGQFLLPAAGAAAAASFIPGLQPLGGMAVDASQALLMPGFEAGASLISGAITSSIAGALPFGGQAIGAGFGNLIGGSLLGVGGAASAIFPALLAGNAAKQITGSAIAALPGSKDSERAGRELTIQLLRIGKEVKTLVDVLQIQKQKLAKLNAQIPSKAEFKALPPQERVQKATVMGQIAAQGIVDTDTMIESLPIGARTASKEGNSLANIKGQFSRQLKKAKQILRKEGINADDVINMKNITSQVEIVGSKINQSWQKTTKDVEQKLRDLEGKTNKIGYEIQKDVGEGSPGTTQRIRAAWSKTTKFIKDRIQEIRDFAKNSGQNIEQEMSLNIEPEFLEGESEEVKEINRNLENSFYRANRSSSRTDDAFQRGMRQAEKEVEDSTQKVEDAFKPSPASIGMAEKLLNFGKNFAISAIGLYSLDMMADRLGRIIQMTFAAGSELERFDIQMTSIGENGAVKRAEIFERSQDLGTNYLTSREGYQSFVQSVQGTGDDAIIDPIFEGFRDAFTSQRATKDAQQRGYRAIEQILSKGGLDGSVQSEELKGQLAEALKGSYATAARVRGESPRELAKQMKAANVEAADLLLRMAAFYEVENEILLRLNSQSFDAELNRLENNVTKFREQIGEQLLTPGQWGLKAANLGLSMMTEHMGAVVTIGGTLAVYTLSKIASAMYEVASSAKLGTAAMRAFGIESLKQTYMDGGAGLAGGAAVGKRLGGGLLGAGAKLAPYAAAATIIYQTGDIFLNGNKGETKEATDILREINNGRRTNLDPEFEYNTGKDGFFRFFNIFNENVRARQEDGSIRNFTLGGKEAAQLSNLTRRNAPLGIEYAQESLDRIGANLDSTNFKDLIDDLKAINGEISLAQGERLKLIETGEIDKLSEVDGRIGELNKKKKDVLKNISADDSSLASIIKSLKTQRDALEKNRLLIDFDTYQQQASALDELLSLAETKANQIEEAIKAAGSRSMYVLREGRTALANARFNLEIELNNQNIQAIEQKLNGLIGERELEIILSQDSLGNKQKNLQVIQDEKARLFKALQDEAGYESVKQKTYNTQSEIDFYRAISEESPESIEEKLKLEEITPELTGALNLIKDFAQLNLQESQTKGSIAQTENELAGKNKQLGLSIRELGNSIRDMSRSLQDLAISKQRFEEDFPLQIQDTRRNLERSTEGLQEQYDDLLLSLDQQLAQTTLDLLQLEKSIKATKSSTELTLALAGNQSIGREIAELYDSYLNSLQSDQELEIENSLDRLQIEQQTINTARQIRNFSRQREDLERDRYRQELQLKRQQEDFNLQQQRTWEDTLDKWFNIELQARELGISLDTTVDQIGQQGTNLIESLAQLGEKIKTEGIEAFKKAIEVPARDPLPVPKHQDIPTAGGRAVGRYYIPASTMLPPPPSVPDAQNSSPSTTTDITSPINNNVNNSIEQFKAFQSRIDNYLSNTNNSNIDTSQATAKAEELTALQEEKLELTTEEKEALRLKKLADFIDASKNKFKQLESSLRQSQRSTADIELDIYKLSANRKGYLTDEEQIMFAGLDTTANYEKKIQDLEDRKRKLREDFAGVEQSIPKIQNAVDANLPDAPEQLEKALAARQVIKDELAALEGLEVELRVNIDLAKTKAELEKAFELDIAQRDRSLNMQKEIFEAQKESGNNFTFGANGTRARERELGKLELQLDYDKRLKKLDELKEDNGELTEKYVEQRAALEKLNAIKYDNLIEQTSTWGKTVRESIYSALDAYDYFAENLIGNEVWDTLLGTVKQFATNFLKVWADLGAQVAKEHIGNWLLGKTNEAPNSGQGEGLWGTLGSGLTSSFVNNMEGFFSLFKDIEDSSGFTGNTVQLPSFNAPQQKQNSNAGLWNILGQIGVAAISSLRYGDEMEIPNYSKGSDTLSMAAGLQKAIDAENHPHAFPAVLHKGEKVLSDLISTTGYGMNDAQLWESIKMGHINVYQNAGVDPQAINNFNYGSDRINSVATRNMQHHYQAVAAGDKHYNYEANFKFTGVDEIGFRKSQRQIAYEQKKYSEELFGN